MNNLQTIGGQLAPGGRDAGRPALAYVAHLQGAGRGNMERLLARVARQLGGAVDTVPWEKLRAEHVQAILSAAAQGGAEPATVNVLRSALRGVMKEAWREERIDAETLARIMDVPPIRGHRLPAGRMIESGEVDALFRAIRADKTPMGPRDGALLALGMVGGLRRAELSGLTLDAVKEEEGGAYAVRVMGKGNSERICYIDNGGASWLREWLTVRGAEPGPLFFRARKGGHLQVGEPLSGSGVLVVLQSRARQAGLASADDKTFSPHDMRRTMISNLLEKGVDLSVVSQLVGHAGVQTTARYDRRGEGVKRQAVKTLHVPYRGRPG